jgi:hypothetical protein
MSVSDIHTVSNRMLNLLLYPVAGWGIALVGLYVSGQSAWALPLLYAIAIWQTALAAWWGRDLLARLDREEVTYPQANAGVKSVGRILAATSLAPVMVFFCRDPFAPESWSTSFGVCVVAAVSWVAVNGLVRVPGKWSHGLALFVAALALPISATGSVTVASMMGWYLTVVESTPLPDLIPHG